MKKLTPILFSISVLFFALNAIAAIKANVNNVTDSFDKHIDNKEALLGQLEKQRKDTVGGVSGKQHLSLIAGGDGAEANAQQLNSIRAVDLDQMGREKRASEEFAFYDENELEPNWEKPGNRMHKEDADAIADATGKILGNLMSKLKEIGVDCKTVKGPIQKEPTYHIEIKREKQRNTEYDQFFCEEPRNKYNCTDDVSLKCIKKGLKYGEWEDRVFWIGGFDFWHNYHGWTKTVKWKRKKWGVYMHQGPVYDQQRRNMIQYKFGWRADQIEGGSAPAWGEEPPTHVEGVHHVYQRYSINYRYRSVADICAEWSEDWTERCNLK